MKSKRLFESSLRVRRRRTKQSPCEDSLYAIILAGGVGSRFWPFSRELEPKQFLKIIKDKSLLQDTVARLKGIVNPGNIYIITNKVYFFEIKRHIHGFKIPDENIILEPQGKNTAPAIGLCSRIISQRNKNASLIVLPADHYIRDVESFGKCLRRALTRAQDDYLVTIGIRPKKAATGYGYIKISHQLNPSLRARSAKQSPGGLLRRGVYTERSEGAPRNDSSKSFNVDKFLEKPSLEKAKKYTASKDYFWNSGIFVWKAAVFERELRKYQPDLYSRLEKINSIEDIEKVWPGIKPVSVDYGVMEHSKRIALIPAEFDWSDLGSWDALEEVVPKDKKGNILSRDSIDLDSQGLCAFSRGNRLIATIGLKDLIIADTPDALLVCDRQRTQEVKNVVSELKRRNRKEHILHLTDRRPWGSYTVLQIADGFKIKLIEIEPKKRLSLQAHRRRSEHWIVVSGSAKVIRGRDIIYVHSNQSIYIPKGVKHRLENPGKSPLKIVEVQTGPYLEEDDIERFDDDYKR